MTKKISQREARRLRNRVFQLEAMLRNSYEGINIATWTLNDAMFASVITAKTLGYGLVLHKSYSGTEVKVMAVKL